MDDTHQLWRRLEKVLATGRWNPSGGVHAIPGGELPLLMESCEGCRSTDSAGRTYIDYMMGWGTALLGFRHPKVEEAIRNQISKGLNPSLIHPIEIEVGEQLVSMIPCAETVAFGKNGSDVLAMAVRMARGYTRRERVLVHGYHGIHDWFMAGVEECPGIPESLRSLVTPFPYNDLDALEERLDPEAGPVAAIMMEPVGNEIPGKGYLEGVRELANEYGAVLVFDEVMTGFRMAPGGAQEYYNVSPDLACYSKSLANGMPLSAVVGPAFMAEAVAAIMYGLTFRGELLSMAAARAALSVYQEEPVAEHVWTVGERLRESLEGSGRKAGVPIRLHGPSPRMTMRIPCEEPLDEEELLTLFTQECIIRGVLHNTRLIPSYAHDEASVEKTCAVFADALEVVARAMDQKSVKGLLHIPALELWSRKSKKRQSAAGGRDCE